MNEWIRKSRPGFNGRRQNMGCATFQRARSLSLQFRTVSRRGVTEPATISTNNPGHPEPAWAGLKVEKQVKRAWRDWNPIRAEVSSWQQKRCLSTLLKLILKRQAPSKARQTVCLWNPAAAFPRDDGSASVSDTQPILSCGTGGGFFLLKVSWWWDLAALSSCMTVSH